ncbi:linoleate 13S-lipoxygenase 3-1, chloroplastic-like protein, partial [Tanacetum coccineum]
AISEDLVKLVRVEKEKPVTFKVRAVLTVRNKNKEDFFKDTIFRKIDAITDQIGWNVVIQLFSNEIDPRTRAAKKSNEAVLKDWSKKSNVKTERVNYTADIMVDSDFGIPGAITISNKH